MPKPPKHLSEPCPHDIRPGTTVCLHCRHAERLVTRARRRRYALRSSVVGSVVATLGAAGVLGATVIRARSPHAAQPQQTVSQRPVVQPTTVSAGNVAIVPQPATPAQPTAPTHAVIATAPAPVSPIVPAGRSELPDGIVAMRSDSEVVLSFDTKLARTRMPDKFERFVRATLPAIYGVMADSALARIPQGGLAQQGDLINELPTRGMRIPVASGGTIALYPITRPGQDGPLVTRYRVLVIKG